MSELRYRVVFTSKVKSHLDEETVKGNLALELNLSNEMLSKMFSGKEVLLKRFAALNKAERFAAKFDYYGALCYIVDTEAKSGAIVATGAESSLMLTRNSFLKQDERETSSLIMRMLPSFKQRKACGSTT